MHLFLFLLAHAEPPVVDSENCSALWADTFNAGRDAKAGQSGNGLFRALDKLEASTKKKRPEVQVLSCTAGPPDTSTIDVWYGHREFDANGNAIVQGTCTSVDVIEVQGKKRDTCRRFPTSRICLHKNDRTKVHIAVGDSQLVDCPAD